MEPSYNYERCVALIEENMKLQRKTVAMDRVLAVCYALESQNDWKNYLIPFFLHSLMFIIDYFYINVSFFIIGQYFDNFYM